MQSGLFIKASKFWTMVLGGHGDTIAMATEPDAVKYLKTGSAFYALVILLMLSAVSSSTMRSIPVDSTTILMASEISGPIPSPGIIVTLCVLKSLSPFLH